MNRRSDRGVMICVHPDFRTLIKTESASKGKSIIQYSAELAKSRRSLIQEEDSIQERRRGFGFRI